MGKRKRTKGIGLEARLLSAGGVLLVLPMFIRQPAIHAAFEKLQLLGLLLLLAGLVIAVGTRVLASRGKPSAPEPAPEPAARPTRKRRQSIKPQSDPVAEPALAPTIVPDVADASPSRVKPEVWGPEVFSLIEWRRFEAVVEALFAQAGFETKSQSHGADGGVDVWLYSKNMPGQPVSIVQCKHWQGKSVGVDKVRELRGVMAAHGIKRGQFATTSTFTADAQAFAKENGVNLLDIAGLLGLIGKRTPEQQAELLAVATEGEYWRPTCANCGIKLIERKGREGRQFWGCANYPRCRATIW